MLTFYKLFYDNKKKLKAKVFKPFFFKYCWNNWTFKWGKKTIYWLHFLNLPPLKELQQIFVLYEAKVMIYWQKKWKKYKKLTPSLQFLMQTKNIGSNSRFAKVYCCPTSTYPTCVSRPPCFLIFRWLSSLFLQLLVFLLQ